MTPTYIHTGNVHFAMALCSGKRVFDARKSVRKTIVATVVVLAMTVRAVARAVVLVAATKLRLTAATSLLRLAHLPSACARLLTPRKENKHAATLSP